MIVLTYRGQVPVLGLGNIVASEEDHTESDSGEEPEEDGVTDDGLEAGHEGRGEEELQLVQGQGEAAPHTPGLRRKESLTVIINNDTDTISAKFPSHGRNLLRLIELSKLSRCKML